jgi:hypothetical protein
MKLYKDISFWCIVLALVVVMVVHHFLSKGQLIEGNTNDEKCGAGSGIPCCWYNMWQDVEGGEDLPPIPNALENLKTDGTVYLPLSMSGGIPTPEERTTGTWQECQQRCINTPGCVYFNRIPNGTCFITDGSGGEQIGIDNDTGGPSEDPEGKPTHSGRALALRENIPEDKRFGLDQCKCAAAGGEPTEGWPDTGTPIDQSALQYGDNRISSDVDCSSTPTPSSCDAYGQRVSITIDPTKATHFKCLVKSEVDGTLRDKATNLGVDISGIDTNSDNFQSTIRDTMLNHISIRDSYGLDGNAPQSAIDNLLEEKRLLRLKYNLPWNASDTDIKQKQDERRSKYNVRPSASEEELEDAIINREMQADLYGIDAESETWTEDLAAAMVLRGSTALEREQAKYCTTKPDCNDDELQEAKNTWNQIRTNLNLPINATNEQVSAAIIAQALYDFNTHTFTNCGKNGRYGPTLSECKAAYAPDGESDSGPSSWVNNESFFAVRGAFDGTHTHGGIQVWTVPVTGDYDIDVYGASGGAGTNDASKGGRGARIKGRFTLTKGDLYWIIVGQMGTRAVNPSSGGGGGGGSFFVKVPDNDNVAVFNTSKANLTMDNLLIAAGGGGGSSYGGRQLGEDASGSPVASDGEGGAAGAGYSTGGGGGFLLDGSGRNPTSWAAGRRRVTTGGSGFKTGGLIGGEGSDTHYPPGIHGGFGGGGGSSAHAGGGGGGATGGSGPPGSWNADPNGRAGTSYIDGNSGTPETGVSTLSHPANGQIIITLIEVLPGGPPSPPSPPEPNTLENIYTDGRWYMPLNGIDGEEQTQATTWEDCRDRCLNTPNCKFFNRFSSGGCHITDGILGHVFRPGNPTSHSGSAGLMEREVTLPMPEEIDEDNYSAVTGGTVDCSAPDMKFLGVADSIRHNGHSSNWGNSMIDVVSEPGSKIQDYKTSGNEIPCGNFYYYKPHTLSNLETEEGGGWFQNIGDNGVSPSGFYTLQHIGSAGSDSCTNWAVRTNQSNISDYACSEQGPMRKEDPSIPNPSDSILQGLGITSDN